MDEILDFFDFSKPFERIVIPGPNRSGGNSTDNNIKCEKIPKREPIGNEYAKNLAQAHELGLLNAKESEVSQRSTSHFMETMESDDDDDDEDVDMLEVSKNNYKLDEVYNSYNFSKKIDLDLPVTNMRDKILKTIQNDRVIIIEGDTGCGKTTQIPQFILDEAYKNRTYCNIVCTQPRRIAAISIAQRVCDEREWKIGTIVGYQVGLHKDINVDTRLLYCTTGILLQKLIKTKSLSTYTHIILDEVHERDQEMDFLLILIKKLISSAPETKVILMSATINSKRFSEYFQIPKGKILFSAPILKVDAKRPYIVKDFYFDNLEKITSAYPDFKLDFENPGISETLYKIVLKLIINLEVMDDGDDESQCPEHKPSALIFLPGVNEIDKMEKTLEALQTLSNGKIPILVVRLYSMVSPDEQQKAFKKPLAGYRKIILATNIAESSITVPDVKYVIDFCLTKSLQTDTNSGLTSLKLQWASKSNCKQRAGRAGRVMNGRVFRLIPQYIYSLLPEYGSPEMTRCPLENIVLKAKMLDMGKPDSILGLALDPPNLSDIRNTILILKEAGALYQTSNNVSDIDDGDLTFIGRIMAQLPIDINFSRLIVFGYIFSILDETIIIAAGLNVKSIFDTAYHYPLSAYASKLTWASGSGSDLFAIINAYKVWASKFEQRHFQNDAESQWARRYYINTKSMREMHYLILELRNRLEDIGLRNIIIAPVNWLDHEKAIILRVAIAGAFYPNYFLRSSGYETQQLAYQTLYGRDPYKTVYFTGFDNKYIGELYVQYIKDIFKKATIAFQNIQVTFENGTQKIFVTFNDSNDKITNTNNLQLSVPGRVCPEVYKAIKLRQLRYPTSLRVMPSHQSAEYAIAKGLGEIVDGRFTFFKNNTQEKQSHVIPSVFIKYEHGKISYIENCGKFWFQPQSVENQLKCIVKELNNYDILFKFTNCNQISRGIIVAAKYKGWTYRAKVLYKEEETRGLIHFKVLFIDYGNIVSINIDNIYGLKKESQNFYNLPARALQCYLAGISPSAIDSITGQWSEKSTEYFKGIIKRLYDEKRLIEIEIYSVVNSISAVIIKTASRTVNDLLVHENFAQFSEESYLSKIDNDLRMRKQAEQCVPQFEHYNKSQSDAKAFDEEYYSSQKQDFIDYNLEPPPANKCVIKLDIRGPSSPLETQCYLATRLGECKRVRIERDSVNCVLLNTDPHENHETLIVAASVNETADGDVLTARQTTIMPNIKGFAPLMAMIFCPKIEMRRSKDKTRYINVLCGLGPKDDNSTDALFAEHDICLILDVKIEESDIQIINQIRYTMDTILYPNSVETNSKISLKQRNLLTGKIKHLIIQLLEKQRKYIEVETDSDSYDWNKIDKNDMYNMKNLYAHHAIFPLHDCMRLYNETNKNIKEMTKNCQELHEYKRQNNFIPTNLKCLLCGHNLDSLMQLKIHLLSKLHLDRESEIKFNE